MSTIVCIGTGPSLALTDIDAARRKGFRLFGCNNVFQIVPDLELTYACNLEWWQIYWGAIQKHPCEKWTTNETAARVYGVNYIRERGGEGLCQEPNVIHHGHGSGFSLLSMAHKAGARRVILLGYDMHYAADYDGHSQRIGSTPRHSELLLPGGEYPAALQHWPKVAVKNGRHFELIRLYETVREQGLIEIVNGSPTSPFEVFPHVDIEALNAE